MPRAIAKEDTLGGAKRELFLVVRAKVWPTCTPKSSKRLIIWFGTKEAFNRGVKLNNFCRQKINEKCSYQKSFIPKFE
jgi:hypothetical protein